MKSKVINVEEYVDQIYHSEDGELREGGLWPEYTQTMIICVDSYKDRMAAGRIHNYCFEEVTYFRTLDQILFGLESILDRSCAVQRDTALRKRIREFDPKSSTWKYVQEDIDPQVDLVKRKPFYPFNGLAIQPGDVATFHIRIYSRYFSSMQGTISTNRSNKVETMAFRSAMELLTVLCGELEAIKQ